MLIDQRAPDFTCSAYMPDGSFKDVKLSDYKGQYVVLFFYPADFTFVCASEVPGFNNLFEEFNRRGCVVLGCSTDTHHCHKGWCMLSEEQGGLGLEGKLKYPLLGDRTKEVAKAYDVLLEDGLCTRGVFLIDRDGFVKQEHRNGGPLGRNLDEPLRLLDALKFHEESVQKGNPQVCPASWKLGKKAMSPSMEGVAKFNKEGGVQL